MSASAADPDAQYAKGEIPREDWLRLRRSTSQATPPPRRDDRRRGVLVAAIVLAVGLTLAGAFLWSMANSPHGGWSPAWSPSFGTARTLPATDLTAINDSATSGAAYAGNDSLWFSGDSVDLAVYMSPPDHDMTFVLENLVNPTLHVPAGARVTVTIVNMDPDMDHNWALSRTGPPYSSMPMMGSGSMMSMTMLGPMSGAGYPSESISFTAVSGAYWYLCEYAGHAAAGMYGGFDIA